MDGYAERPGSKVAGYIVAGLGILLLLLELPFALAFGLVGAMWATVLMTVVWAFLFVIALRWFKSRSYWVIVLPFVGAAIWLAAVYAGEAFLGWTA